MTTPTPAQLHHLADRARRGVLLPAEGALLADAVAEMGARIVTLEAVCESNKRAYKGAVQAAWTAGAAIERVRAWADDNLRYVDRTELLQTLDEQPPTTTEAPVHLPKGTNAEDCPACKGTNPDYPFLCPGPEQQPTA